MVFSPGKPHGRGALVGYSPWRSQRVGHDWSDLARVHSVDDVETSGQLTAKVKIGNDEFTEVGMNNAGGKTKIAEDNLPAYYDENEAYKIKTAHPWAVFSIAPKAHPFTRNAYGVLILIENNE